MNDEMLDPANDPANWDCCDEHETVFWKGDVCPKCEPEPTERKRLDARYEQIMNEWAVGRLAPK